MEIKIRKNKFEKTFSNNPYTPTPHPLYSFECQQFIAFSNIRKPYINPTPEPDFSEIQVN